MARTPRPWYRSERDTWYVCLDGRQVPLARGKEARDEAHRAFHRIMADRGRLEPVAAPARLVGELIAAWLASLNARAARGDVARQTPADYVRRLGSFPDEVGSLVATHLRPHHIHAWLDRQTSWGATSRHDAVGAIKACMAWAAREGLIDRDPLAGMKRPPRPKRREHVMAPDLLPRVLEAIVSPHFRRLVEFLWATGCRPGEARRLEWSHVDLGRRVAILPGKTTRKTGRKIAIRLTDQAIALLGTPGTGHVFQNEDGKPWQRDALKDQMIRIRGRLANEGHDTRGVVLYALRHLFARDGLQRGAGVVEMSLLLNHASPRMLFDVYGDLSSRDDHLRATLDVVRPESDKAHS